MDLYRSASASLARYHGEWKPTIIRFGPLSGIFCMLVAAASIVASLGIVAGSDGDAVEHWSSPPSTYLAIFVAGANLSIRYAAIQGILIAWWLRALRGSTLSKLHWDWRAGTTLRGAITSGQHTGLLGLACIFSTLVVIAGPLLQRSSTVIDRPMINEVVPLNVSMAPEVPTGLGGSWFHDDALAHNSIPSGMFNKTSPASTGRTTTSINLSGGHDIKINGLFQEQAPLQGVVQGCHSKCRLKLRGPALFPTTCRTEIIELQLQDGVSNIGVINGSWTAPLNHVIFMVSPYVLFEAGCEAVNLVTAFATLDNACQGTLNLGTCSLEAGIGEYDVVVENDEISLQSLGEPTFIAWANNTAVAYSGQAPKIPNRSTLANIIVDASWGRSVSLSLYYGMSPPDYTYIGNGILEPYEKNNMHEEGGYCPSFKDPRLDIQRSLKQLMIYSGAVAAAEFEESHLQNLMDPGLQVNYATSGYLEGTHSVFHTEYSWFIAAAIVELVCISIILPTYWGWWRIGRSVSFSPLELAKAFESPLLADYPSNSTGRDLAKAVGDSTVKYGVQSLDEGHEELKFAFGLLNKVTTLSKDMQFGEEKHAGQT